MPQVVHHHKRFRPIPAVIIIVLLVVLVVGLWQAYVWMQAAQAKSNYNAAMARVQGLDEHSKYAAAQTVLQNYLHTNPPTKYRYTALLLLGDLAYDNRQDTVAVQDYKQAVAANGGKMTEIAAEDIGQAAASAGDKATALTYYKQALALTISQPGVSNDAADLQATVQNLESSQ